MQHERNYRTPEVGFNPMTAQCLRFNSYGVEERRGVLTVGFTHG
jgi:hypothetical protein